MIFHIFGIKNNVIPKKLGGIVEAIDKNLRQEKFISGLSACQLFDDCQTSVAENFHCFLSRLLILACLDYEWWF